MDEEIEEAKQNRRAFDADARSTELWVERYKDFSLAP